MSDGIGWADCCRRDWTPQGKRSKEGETMNAQQSSERYYLAENGEAVGPFTMEQLRAMFTSGRVHAGSQVCMEGASAWQAASALALDKKRGGSAISLNSWDRAGLGLCLASIVLFLAGASTRVDAMIATAMVCFVLGLVLAGVGRFKAER